MVDVYRYVPTFSFRHLLGLCLSLGLCLPVAGQRVPPARLWDHVYGGNKQDEPAAMMPTADGGCIIGGSSTSGAFGTHSQPGMGHRDYWLVKLSAQGEQQWDQRFGGSEEDQLGAVRPTADGGYLLCGSSYSHNGGDKSENNAIWQGPSFWLVKTNSAGLKQWDKTIMRNEVHLFRDMVETEEGGYLLAGEISGGNEGSYDFSVVKVTARGQVDWGAKYGGTKHEQLCAVRRTPDNGFLLAGTSPSEADGDNKTEDSRGGQDYWVVKISALGIKEWDRTYGGPGDDRLATLQLTPDGGFILGGTSTSGVGGEKTQPSRGDKDMWVVKVNAAGAVEWDRRFGGALEETLSAVLVSGGGYLLGGSSWSGSGGDKAERNWGYCDYWLLRLDGQGNLLWERRYGGEGIDQLAAITEQPDGSCLVAGYSTSSGLRALGDKTQENYGFLNFWVIKMAALTPLSVAEPGWAGGLTVSPVPASTELRVQLPAIPGTQPITLAVLDLLGRVVHEQAVPAALTRPQEVTLPVGALARGHYLLRVAAANTAPVVRRVVIQ